MPDSRDRSSIPPAFDDVQIFIDPDGTVTICDLWEGLLPVVEALGDEAPAGPTRPDAPAVASPEDVEPRRP